MQQLIERSPQPLDKRVSDLSRRICVAPPYFALTHVQYQEHLTAVVRAETKPQLEVGPMTAAEIGRHSAIAGLSSVALGRTDSRRHYYLARSAECVFYPSSASFGSAIRLRASGEMQGQRDAEARILTLADGRPLARLVVRYSVLPEAVFARMFAKQQRNNLATPLLGHYNDYSHIQSESNGRGRLEQVQASSCSGHFPNYPALPVAVLMGQLIRLAGQELGCPYRVWAARVEASALAWADQDVALTASQLHTSGRLRVYNCTAHVQSQLIGRMELSLELV
jgi:hypothetical protein